MLLCQRLMHEESQLMATFPTPLGRYFPVLGPFGLISMLEIFGKCLDALMQGVKGNAKSMDDFLVYGRNVQEHDENLHNVLQIMRENNMTLNLEMCCLLETEANFLGDRSHQKVLCQQIAKLKLKTLSNITELCSFMEMAQQFGSIWSSVSRKLQMQNLSANHILEFNKVKHALSNPPVLALYDVNKPTKLRTDGSKPNGISVVVYQKHENGWGLIDCAF